MLTWDDIKHFKPEEFDSPDKPGSGRDGMLLEFVQKLDFIRDTLGYPLKINSGFRTKQQNMKVGGKARSAHLGGYAADIAARTGAEKYALVQQAFRRGITRIGIGDTFIHLDLSPTLPQYTIWTYPKGAKA